MSRERSSSHDSVNFSKDEHVVIPRHSPLPDHQSGKNTPSEVTGKSQNLTLSGNSTLPPGSAAPSENTGSFHCTTQKPVLHTAIRYTSLSAVYTYTYQGVGRFPLPDRNGQYPLLELGSYTAGRGMRSNLVEYRKNLPTWLVLYSL